MAAPMSNDQYIAALRAEGLTVIEIGSWRTHNRNHKGAWGPINGVILHHTGSSGTTSSVALCRDGYSGLPGPLCQGVISKEGVVYVISNGRANHAGGGDPDVLAAVISEDYGDRPPVPNVGNVDGVDGNARFYGYECINLGDGKDPWPAAQVDAMVRASTAHCRFYGWTSKSVIAHREWSDDKPDPRGPGMPTMPTMRAMIAERLTHPASWDPTSPPPATGTDMAPQRTTLVREGDLTLSPNAPQAIYWDTEYADEPNEHGVGGKTVLYGGQYSIDVTAEVAGLAENQVIEIYAAEEDANGVELGRTWSRSIHGTGNGTVVINDGVHLMGLVWTRLVIKVVSTGPGTVTIKRACLDMQSWPA
jgi:hypothetical protein